MPNCCRTVVANATRTAGQFGDYLCDIPLVTLMAGMNYVVAQQPDFVLDIGDIQPHDIWLYNESLCLDRMSRMSQRFADVFQSKDIQSVHTLGNHDSRTIDQFAEPQDWQWFLRPLATEIWRPFLDSPADQMATILAGGYYAADAAHTSKLRIISLNTQFADPLNFYAMNFPADPGNQLAWLSVELAQTRQRGQMAIILGHIPLGMAAQDSLYETLQGYSDRLRAILEMYSDIVQAVISGHMHTDSVRVLLNSSTSDCYGYLLASPSLTTQTHKNPSLRKFIYDRDTGKLLDIVTYNFNLTLANERGAIAWFQSYSMIEDMQLPELSCKAFQGAIDRMWKDDAYWQQYYHWYSSLYLPAKDVCTTSACRKGLLCGMSFQDATSHQRCMLEH